MSQAQFQEALAMLIRLPEHNRVDIEEFLADYQLSNPDKDNLRFVAQQREVFKFGYKMRRGRINYLLESIPISLEVINRDQLTKLIETEFDPEFTLIHARKIYRAFRIYFLSDDPSRKTLIKQYLGELPDYIFDVVNFELLDTELEFQGFQDEDPPTGSALKHMRFEVLSLDYQVHKFVEKKRSPSGKKAPKAPKNMKTHLLFLDDDESECGYQLFEIDESGAQFLMLARQGQKALPPNYYQDFVDCGLCK